MREPVEPQLDELRRRARRRLIGAVVLALAAAVVVPMLLESEPRPLGENVSVRIPPIDDGRFVNKVNEAAKPSEIASAPPRAPATAGEQPAKPASIEPAAPPAPAAGTAPRKSLAQAEQGVLSPGQKARPADTPPAPAAAVKDAGSNPASTSASSTASAPVGNAPTANASAANASTGSAPARSVTAGGTSSGKAPESSAAATMMNAPVSPARPADETAVEDTRKSSVTAKAADGAFSVQLGAFSDDKGANALAGRLKKAGHPAYTEPYETTRGTLWRVRVGPFATRDAAEASRGRLKADGQNGIIAAAK